MPKNNSNSPPEGVPAELDQKMREEREKKVKQPLDQAEAKGKPIRKPAQPPAPSPEKREWFETMTRGLLAFDAKSKDELAKLDIQSEELRLILYHENPEIRLRAVESLLQKSEKTEDILVELAGMLSDESGEIRHMTGTFLREREGDLRAVVPSVVEAVHNDSTSGDQKIRYVSFLAEAGESAAKTSPELAELLHTIVLHEQSREQGGEGLRVAAVDAARRVLPGESIRYNDLLKVYQENVPESPLAVAIAVTVLTERAGKVGEQIPPELFGSLAVSALHHEQAAVRFGVLTQIFRGSHLEKPIAPLLSILVDTLGRSDESDDNRCMAAEALSVVARRQPEALRGNAKAISALKKGLEDSSLIVRFHAAIGLGAVKPDELNGTRASPELVEKILHPKEDAPERDRTRDEQKLLRKLFDKNVKVPGGAMDVPPLEQPPDKFFASCTADFDATEEIIRRERGQRRDPIQKLTEYHEAKITVLQEQKISMIIEKVFGGDAPQAPKERENFLKEKQQILSVVLEKALGKEWDDELLLPLTPEEEANLRMELAVQFRDGEGRIGETIFQELLQHDEIALRASTHRHALAFLSLQDLSVYEEFSSIIRRQGDDMGKMTDIRLLFWQCASAQYGMELRALQAMSRAQGIPVDVLLLRRQQGLDQNPFLQRLGQMASTVEAKQTVQALGQVLPAIIATVQSPPLAWSPLQTMQTMGVTAFAHEMQGSSQSAQKAIAIETLRKTGGGDLAPAIAESSSIHVRENGSSVFIESRVYDAPLVIEMGKSGTVSTYFRAEENRRVFLPVHTIPALLNARLGVSEVTGKLPRGMMSQNKKMQQYFLGLHPDEPALLRPRDVQRFEIMLSVLGRTREEPWCLLKELGVIDATRAVQEGRARQFETWFERLQPRLPAMHVTVQDLRTLTQLWDRYPERTDLLSVSPLEARRLLKEGITA
ncbi:MAG: hypothetical protein V1926_00340 [Candidatus Peregrinibacteria bacterium]